MASRKEQRMARTGRVDTPYMDKRVCARCNKVIEESRQLMSVQFVDLNGGEPGQSRRGIRFYHRSCYSS